MLLRFVKYLLRALYALLKLQPQLVGWQAHLSGHPWGPVHSRPHRVHAHVAREGYARCPEAHTLCRVYLSWEL